MERIKSVKDFFKMYADGFKNMTWGKTLWIIILIKLFIMFAVLKVFFFPNLLNSKFDTDEAKSNFVNRQLTEPRTANSTNSSNVINNSIN
ncbi:MAG: DUF4492 domain-containing protein [Bacteroidales bacterium]|jgi:hypothetical protein|nr:DUF4492 domain-containing protein [Bacteroidales bacterium]